MTTPTILLLGAQSDMARATAHVFARHGYNIQLAGRDETQLAQDAADMRLRYGVCVTHYMWDALDVGNHEAWIAQLAVMPDVVVCAVGLLGDQAQAQENMNQALQILRSNFEGPALILGLFATIFAARGSGVLVGISSVAGVRGRASNYVYGSAKAGLTAFLSGLRQRLSQSNVHVTTIIPGFVASKMTAHLDLPKALTATPQQVGEVIYKAVIQRRNVVYVLKRWRWIMAIIAHMPESLFKRISL